MIRGEVFNSPNIAHSSWKGAGGFVDTIPVIICLIPIISRQMSSILASHLPFLSAVVFRGVFHPFIITNIAVFRERLLYQFADVTDDICYRQ